MGLVPGIPRQLAGVVLGFLLGGDLRRRDRAIPVRKQPQQPQIPARSHYTNPQHTHARSQTSRFPATTHLNEPLEIFLVIISTRQRLMKRIRLHGSSHTSVDNSVMTQEYAQ